jgi:hypothetical protein
MPLVQCDGTHLLEAQVYPGLKEHAALLVHSTQLGIAENGSFAHTPGAPPLNVQLAPTSSTLLGVPLEHESFVHGLPSSGTLLSSSSIENAPAASHIYFLQVP